MTELNTPLKGRIVVGVDGSAASIEALDWAVEEAVRRGATVEVVHAYLPTALEGYLGPTIDPAIFRDAADAVLDAAIEHVARSGHWPTVMRRLVMDNAGPALVEWSKGAELLVVSSRGHGSIAAMVLGSVSSYALHHATCPVVVIPAHQHAAQPS